MASSWARMDAETQHLLIASSIRDARAIQDALIGLETDSDAFPGDQARMLAQAGVRACGARIVAISDVAAYWTHIPADDRRAVLVEAASDPQLARYALATIVIADPDGAPDQQRTLLQAVARDPDACSALIACIAPHWARLSKRMQRTLIRTAAQRPDTAQQALGALLPIAPDLRRDLMRMLVRSVTRDPHAGAALIETACATPCNRRRLAIPAWERLRDVVIAAAARRPDAAQRAPAPLLIPPILRCRLRGGSVRKGSEGEDRGLTPARLLALARACFPHAAWDVIDASRSAGMHALMPAPSHAIGGRRQSDHPYAAAWKGMIAPLTERDHEMPVRAIAPDERRACAYALPAADNGFPLNDRDRRMLAWAIIPAHAALAELLEIPACAPIIAAWPPPFDRPASEEDGKEGLMINATERALWRTALHAGILPPMVAALLMALIPSASAPQRQTCR